MIRGHPYNSERLLDNRCDMLPFRTTARNSVCSILPLARSLALVLLLIHGLMLASTLVCSGSGHPWYMHQFYLVHSNKQMDWSKSLLHALGRRLQNDSGKADDGMYVCIREDGSYAFLGHDDGRRRALRQLSDVPWPYCNETAGGEYPGNAGESRNPFPPPRYPVASPSSVEVDAPQLQSSAAPFAPFRSPIASPTFISATLTPHPTLSDAFFDPDRRHVIMCHVSCALPPFPEQRDRRARYQRDPTPWIDNDDDKSRKHNDVMYDAAVWFFTKVKVVVAEIMRETTNYTIIYNDGHRGGNMSIRVLDESEDSPPSWNESWNEQGQESCNDCDVLLLSERDSNFTQTMTIESGPHAGTIWWMYTIAYITVAPDVVHVNGTIQASMLEAIESGEIYRRLQDRFSRLVAVSQPGYEDDALLASDSSDPGGDNDGDLDGINVYEWDPSRWVGLGLFLGTLSCSLILGMTAIHRRKIVQQQEEWGVGLATEAGINQLLTFGWEFDGQQVRAFNKSKFEYRDDDSMRIGGVLPLHGEFGTITERVGVSGSSQTHSATDGTPSSEVGVPHN